MINILRLNLPFIWSIEFIYMFLSFISAGSMGAFCQIIEKEKDTNNEKRFICQVCALLLLTNDIFFLFYQVTVTLMNSSKDFVGTEIKYGRQEIEETGNMTRCILVST